MGGQPLEFEPVSTHTKSWAQPKSINDQIEWENKNVIVILGMAQDKEIENGKCLFVNEEVLYRSRPN